ncbi:MAG: CHAP domain-containing protein [Solobacterium sp.]|nr:CHAP domain-containing protein [Solobacterium sp.]
MLKSQHMFQTGFKKQISKLLAGTLALALFSLNPSTLLAEGEEDTWGDGGYVTYAAVNPYYGGWSNCTWGAWQLCYDYTGVALPRLGNAGAWYANAASYGYSVGTNPAPLSVGVWSNHVVFVTEVSEDGSMVYIKEGGYVGGYHEGWIPSQSNRNGQIFYGYIYVGSGGAVIPATQIITTVYTYDETTGETVESQVITNTPAQINFPEVNEDVIRVDNVAEDETVKREEQEAQAEIQKEEKEQRAETNALTTKLLCD